MRVPSNGVHTEGVEMWTADQERWRGRQEARLRELGEAVKALENWQADADRQITRMETKVAFYAALGGTASGIVVAFITWALNRG